jgi:hypothetical protein
MSITDSVSPPAQSSVIWAWARKRLLVFESCPHSGGNLSIIKAMSLRFCRKGEQEAPFHRGRKRIKVPSYFADGRVKYYN